MVSFSHLLVASLSSRRRGSGLWGKHKEADLGNIHMETSSWSRWSELSLLASLWAEQVKARGTQLYYAPIYHVCLAKAHTKAQAREEHSRPDPRGPTSCNWGSLCLEDRPGMMRFAAALPVSSLL